MQQNKIILFLLFLCGLVFIVTGIFVNNASSKIVLVAVGIISICLGCCVGATIYHESKPTPVADPITLVAPYHPPMETGKFPYYYYTETMV